MKTLRCCRCHELKMAFNPAELRIYDLAENKYVTFLLQCWSVLHGSSVFVVVVVVAAAAAATAAACSSLRESFSSSRPSDWIRLGVQIMLFRCTAKVVTLPRLCDFVMLGIKVIYFRIWIKSGRILSFCLLVPKLILNLIISQDRVQSRVIVVFVL